LSTGQEVLSRTDAPLVREHPGSERSHGASCYHSNFFFSSPWFIITSCMTALFTFLVSSSVSLWTRPAIHTTTQRRHHPRSRPRTPITLTARLPLAAVLVVVVVVVMVVVAAASPTCRQGQFHLRNNNLNHPRTRTLYNTPRTPPRQHSARPRTSMRTICTPSRLAKSLPGRSSSTTSSGCTPALASPRRAPSSP